MVVLGRNDNTIPPDGTNELMSKETTLPVASGSTPAPGILTRLEGALWLTRPHMVFSKVPISAAGWVVGHGGATSVMEGLFLTTLLASMQAFMFVVNDLHDARRDRITAPYLPLPSNLLSHRFAVAEAVGLGAVFLGSAWALAPTGIVFLVVVMTVPPALGVLAFYSRTKAAWFSSLLGSSAAASFLTWAWLLAGYREPGAFALLYVIASLHGVHNNVRAQLYDIEGDPKAGTVTLAVRLGPLRALKAAAVLRAAELVGIAIFLLLHGASGGWLWLAVAGAFFGVALVRVPAAAVPRDRRGQTDTLFIWVYSSFVTELCVLGTLRPLASVGLGMFMFTWFHVVRTGYYRRLVNRST